MTTIPMSFTCLFLFRCINDIPIYSTPSLEFELNLPLAITSVCCWFFFFVLLYTKCRFVVIASVKRKSETLAQKDCKHCLDVERVRAQQWLKVDSTASDLLLCEVLCEDNFFLEFFKKQFGFYVQILRFRGYNISLLKHLSIQNDTSTASASQNGNWTHFRSFEPSIQRIWSKTNLKASWKIGDF